MQVLIQRRAEIALRSLQKTEQNEIKRTLNKIKRTLSGLLHPDNLERYGFRKNPLSPNFSGKPLYTCEGSPDLQLVFSVDSDTYTLEDIIDRDRFIQLQQQPMAAVLG